MRLGLKRMSDRALRKLQYVRPGAHGGFWERCHRIFWSSIRGGVIHFICLFLLLLLATVRLLQLCMLILTLIDTLMTYCSDHTVLALVNLSLLPSPCGGPARRACHWYSGQTRSFSTLHLGCSNLKLVTDFYRTWLAGCSHVTATRQSRSVENTPEKQSEFISSVRI